MVNPHLGLLLLRLLREDHEAAAQQAQAGEGGSGGGSGPARAPLGPAGLLLPAAAFHAHPAACGQEALNTLSAVLLHAR